MSNVNEQPVGIPYGQWLREKNLSFKVKMNIHTDSGLPQEYINHTKSSEIFERNVERQGRQIAPEDM